jgi:predicted CXXCH cytochrome family protein
MISSNRSRFPRNPLTSAALGLALVVTLLTGSRPTFAQAQQVPNPEQPTKGLQGAACLECHESDKIIGILETPHANFDDPDTPAAQHQCESCHGPSQTHMRYPMQVGNIVFTKHGKTPISARNKACLACHHAGARKHWDEGPHGKKLACNSCHVIHKAKDPMLVRADQAKNCGACHPKIIETAPTATSHPLTGKNPFHCTECHNPHGPVTLTACNECHLHDAATLAKQPEKARDYHERALAQQIECTACHKGFVHALPQITRVEPPPDF